MAEEAQVLLTDDDEPGDRDEGGATGEADLASLPESEELQALIQTGQERGYLTFEEISSTLEEVEITKEQVRSLHAYLIEHGVDVIAADGVTAYKEAKGEDPEAKRSKPEFDLTVEPSLDSLRLYLRSIGRVELRWVAGTKLKLPQRDLRPADLRSVPILTNPNPSTVFTVISEWFGSADMEPEHVSTCNSLSLMAKLVAAGHGVAILPPAIMQAEIKSGQIRVLSTRPAVQPRVLFVAYHGEPAEYQPLVRMAVEAMRETNLLKPI